MDSIPRGSKCTGNLSPGCKSCHQGRSTVIFITGRCNATCFYCPVGMTRMFKNQAYANEKPINRIEELFEEIIMCKSKAASFTGGDPLLEHEKCHDYAQALKNKFGSDWVNRADNAKGWTVDFNLRVSDTQDSDWIIDENNKGKGIGLYVNDGTRQETINFLNQQIVFANANYTKIYDATQEVNYRLTGKKDNLKLYARPDGVSTYKKISDVNFSKTSGSYVVSPRITFSISLLYSSLFSGIINVG
ncbi:hypothetical protein LCGC14_2920570 [marine sediment metagenome]|uniref:Radical SAM core domain-containing protein n=1 Tax=marine sediment metagenome TaxID=412755 RepID=A0A0F8XP01_9ZZZZ